MTTKLVIATVIGVLVANVSAGAVRRRTAETNQTSSDNFYPIVQTEQPILFKQAEYTDKICKNQPTCHLVKNAPEHLQQMGARNCMCDEDCRKYGDCCLDSPFYNEAEQKANYQTYYCSPKDFVYQIAGCPAHYTKADVRAKCETSVTLVNPHDVKLITPVTSVEERMTFANEYCAQCHGNSDYRPWTQTHYCTEDAFQEAALDLDATAERDYLWETTQAAKHVEFDPVTRTFRSTFNNRSYTCPPAISLPEGLRPHTRLCVPTISNCTNMSDRQSVERCRRYTSVVYDQDNQKRYRNRDCATCNGHTTKLPGCVETESVYGAGAAGVLFGMDGKGNAGNDICKTNPQKFCTKKSVPMS